MEKIPFDFRLERVGSDNAISGGDFRSRPGTRKMLEDALREIYNLARAKEIDLPEDITAKTLKFIDSLPLGGTASMQRDIINGKPSELDAQNGAVVRMGNEAGVETPVNSLIYYSLLPMELRARGELQFSD